MELNKVQENEYDFNSHQLHDMSTKDFDRFVFASFEKLDFAQYFYSGQEITSWAKAEHAWQLKLEPTLSYVLQFSSNPKLYDRKNCLTELEDYEKHFNGMNPDDKEPSRRLESALRNGFWIPRNSYLGRLLSLIGEGRHMNKAFIIMEHLNDKPNTHREMTLNKSELAQFKIRAQKFCFDHQLRENNKLLKKFTESYFKSIPEAAKQAEKTVTDELKELKEDIAQTKESFSDLKTAYLEDMKLKASEKMWDARSKIHIKEVSNHMLWFSLSLILGLILLGGIYYGLDQIFPYESDGKAKGFNIFYTVIYTGPAILYIWVLRIILGNYRKQQAMLDDARERQTMIKTFKALEMEGKADSAERAIILQALFRPQGQNLEDGLPSPILEAMLKKVDTTPKGNS